MKFRMIALILIVTLAGWLPAAAQQAATPETPATQGQTPAAKPACGCCDHKDLQGKEAAAGQQAKACCQGKDAKEMACCKKDGKDAKTAMNCCNAKNGKGVKDAKMCASKDGKACCGKDATACIGKEGKECCAGLTEQCSAHAKG